MGSNLCACSPGTKCHTEKPCTSCLRRGVDCVPRSIPTRGRRRKRSDSIASQKDVAAVDDFPESKSVPENCRGSHDDSVQSSWLGLARGLLADDGKTSERVHQATHALPWAPDVTRQNSNDLETIDINEFIQVELPPKAVLDLLLDAYFDKTQWFMLIFHEPSFRQRYDDIFTKGSCKQSDSSFLRLCMTLFALGARHFTIATDSVLTAVEFEKLRKGLMFQVEAEFMQLLDNPNIQTVQICLLLGSYITYEGRLSAGFAIVGTGVSVARLMSLSYEPGWREMAAEVREEYRRTWWALEMVDKFDAVKSGRSAGITDSQVQVSMPEDIGDVDKASDLPSLLAYHHSKFMLYRILSPVLLDRTVTVSQRVMKSITSRIQEWESKLPPHLQWGSAEELKAEEGASAPRRQHVEKLRLQAFALHSSYNILKIILHRPFVFTPTSGNDSLARAAQSRASWLATFETALRISSVSTRFPLAAADVLSSSYAATQAGITMFTAGVVLSYIALLNPHSTEAHAACNGIARIVATQSDQKARHILLSPQSARVLDDLVQRIKSKQAVRAQPSSARESQHDTQLIPQVNASMPPQQLQQQQQSRQYQPEHIPTVSNTASHVYHDNNQPYTASLPPDSFPIQSWEPQDHGEWFSDQSWFPASGGISVGLEGSQNYVVNNHSHSAILNDVQQVLQDQNAMDSTLNLLFGKAAGPWPR